MTTTSSTSIFKKFVNCKRITKDELTYLNNKDVSFNMTHNIKTHTITCKSYMSNKKIQKALKRNPEMLEFFI